MIDSIKNEISQHIEVTNKLVENLLPEIHEISNQLVDTINRGKKIILFGNGGSAADAQHIAAELSGRYRKERRGLPALALTTDTSALTAISNDYGFKFMFSRQVEAIANESDTVIGISIKAGNYRDVPLHQQVVDLGFIEFVNGAKLGPLFHSARKPERFATAAGSISNEVARWLRRSGIAPEGLMPNHGWRHRFKTVAREIGASDRVTDAICGHAGKTAGDDYGDVTIAAKCKVIDALPPYPIN